VSDSFLLKLKRGETPFFRLLNRSAKAVITANLPLPRVMNPALGRLYGLHQGVMEGLRRAVAYLYNEPLFRGRCEQIGKRFSMSQMPYVMSHAKIFIGDDVNFFGKVDIFSGRIFDEPRLVLGNRVDIGHNVSFTVNKEIVIEDDVNVASGVRFMDTDAHPKDMAERLADLPPRPEEIKPVRICKCAWIGQNAFILKGVTVGEGAVVGVNSVVVSDIPAYAVAMGNPARVVVKGAKPVS
jgi:acetyltransferase-like isoleucine patch superfamily enzyme